MVAKLGEKECLDLLGAHCWMMSNAYLVDSYPPKFKRHCKHCEKIEYKTMDEMNREERAHEGRKV